MDQPLPVHPGERASSNRPDWSVPEAEIAGRSIAMMIEELDQLNRGLEQLVEERTVALRQSEEELRAQNLRFDAALNNMSQALLMFDSSARLVISNHRYQEMYALSSDIVNPGCPLRELLQHRRDNGTFSDDPDSYIESLMTVLAQGKTWGGLMELPDGRTISVLNHPMAGGGWVATHEDITERRRAEKQIAHMARHDSLTDLPNRVLLSERLAHALAELPRDRKLAVLYLDLDHFKGVNDSLGHQIGDELLRTVAARLRGCVREVDTVARVGGDEFAIIHAGIEQPNEAAILQLFGSYRGTTRVAGLRGTNPFYTRRKVSLRARNLNGERLKVNDKRGNPIEIAAVVVWQIEDTARALYEVDNFVQFVAFQAETAVRLVATSYPYDTHGDGAPSLLDNAEEITATLSAEIAARVRPAGVKVIESRITRLAYAPEIAQAMLRRQQASAVVAARKRIVEGAVGMVQMALERLEDQDIVTLDDERKATMVSNLLVVLCSDQATQPVVNVGSLYQ